MKKKNFEKELEDLKEIAKSLTIRDKHHETLFFPIINEVLTFPITLSFSQETKYSVTDAIKQMLKEKQEINGYILISESWVTRKADKNKKLDMPKPSTQPDRQECLIIAMAFRDGKKKLIMCPFRRTENENIIFEKDIINNEFMGEFALFEEEK